MRVWWPPVLEDVRWSVADNCISVISRFGLYNQVIFTCGWRTWCSRASGDGMLVRHDLDTFDAAVMACMKAKDNQ